MQILCIKSQYLNDDLRRNIRINHKLYTTKHKLKIEYSESILSSLDVVQNSESCLVINEDYIFANLELDFRSFLDDSYLYLIAKDQYHNLNAILDNIYIFKQSPWTELLLKELDNNKLSSIKEYIKSCIEYSESTKLQNIKILHYYFSVLMTNIKSNNIIPKNTLLIDIFNTNIDIMQNDCAKINKYLGIRN